MGMDFILGPRQLLRSSYKPLRTSTIQGHFTRSYASIKRRGKSHKTF